MDAILVISRIGTKVGQTDATVYIGRIEYLARYCDVYFIRFYPLSTEVAICGKDVGHYTTFSMSSVSLPCARWTMAMRTLLPRR